MMAAAAVVIRSGGDDGEARRLRACPAKHVA